MEQNETTEIDYRAEVLKVYPDARSEWYILQFGGLQWFVFEDNASNKPNISGIGNKTEPEAWQSAYEVLKQDGKL